MALKGISWIEQNCEKLIAGVFGVGLLGVVAMQFVGVSSQVTLGTGKTGKTVPVEEAFLQVGSQAKSINDIITSPDPVELRDIQAKLPSDAGVQATFQSKHGNVAPRPALATAIDKPRVNFGGDAKSIRDTKGGGGQKFMYAAVNAPAPAKPVGVSYLATIHPVEYLNLPELQQILPPNPLPKDKASVSLEATFDGVAFADLLSQDPDGQGPLSALPTHWWAEQNTAVLAVELERQELKPDGSWTEATKVKHMPGRVDLSPQIEKVAASGVDAMKSLMEEATLQAADIRHPKYYEIIFGEEWVTPSDAITILAAEAAAPVGGPASDDATVAKRELAGVDKEITNVKELMAGAKGPDGRPVPPRTPGPGSAGGKGGPGAVPGPGASPKDPKVEQARRLEARLMTLEKKREAIIEKWSRKGVELEAAPKKADPAAPPVTPEKAEVEPHLLENPAARIVAHDVTVARGKTYRYRISLVFNNPIYGKVVAATPDQEKLTKAAVVHSAASDWSDPVSVDAETYYFITSATAQDALSHSSRAGAELYIFRWGYWRKGGLTVEPGDILATEVKVPDFTKQLAALADPKAPGSPMPPETIPSPGGGKGRPVGPRPERPERPDGTPGVGKQEETIVYSQVPVSHEAVMLEVAQTAVVTDQGIAKTKTENQVFLRDADGEIVVRNPDGDRGSGLYRKLASSATKGDEAIKARTAAPVDPDGSGPDPKRPGKEKPPPPPPPGGGGGGGGG